MKLSWIILLFPLFGIEPLQAVVLLEGDCMSAETTLYKSIGTVSETSYSFKDIIIVYFQQLEKKDLCTGEGVTIGPSGLYTHVTYVPWESPAVFIDRNGLIKSPADLRIGDKIKVIAYRGCTIGGTCETYKAYHSNHKIVRKLFDVAE